MRYLSAGGISMPACDAGSIRTFFVVCTLLALFAGCSKLPAAYQTVSAENGRIRIPVGEVNDGKVHFYTYKNSGKRINFFIRTDGTGDLSAYFDACYTCYKHKKGYRQEGTDIICNECSMKFKLAEKDWRYNEGCCPIPLKSSVSGGFIVIMAEHIEKGAKLF